MEVNSISELPDVLFEDGEGNYYTKKELEELSKNYRFPKIIYETKLIHIELDAVDIIDQYFEKKKIDSGGISENKRYNLQLYLNNWTREHGLNRITTENYYTLKLT